MNCTSNINTPSCNQFGCHGKLYYDQRHQLVTKRFEKKKKKNLLILGKIIKGWPKFFLQQPFYNWRLPKGDFFEKLNLATVSMWKHQQRCTKVTSHYWELRGMKICLTLKLPRIWLLNLPSSCYTFPCVIAARI